MEETIFLILIGVICILNIVGIALRIHSSSSAIQKSATFHGSNSTNELNASNLDAAGEKEEEEDKQINSDTTDTKKKR